MVCIFYKLIGEYIILIEGCRKIYKGSFFITGMLRVKKLSEVLGRNAYTDAGDFLGQVEEVNLTDNKVDGWRIKVTGDMSRYINGARGIIIPHQFVKAVGDVFIINKASLPLKEETEREELEEAENKEE